MHTGGSRIMLRNLVMTGLTAVSLAALAATAHAGNRSNGAAHKRSESAHHGQPGAPDPDAERSVRPPAPAAKKVVKLKVPRRAGAGRRVARRVQGAVVNQSLLRQSWTVADLNPMPALLDLDDTAKKLRRATAEIARLMTR